MTSYSGAPITSIGVCRVTLRFKNRRISTSIEVVRDKCRPALLGGLDCHMLGLVKRVHTMQNEVSGDDETMRREVKKKFPQLFQGTGTLPEVHTIVLKDGNTAVVHAPRRVAVAKREQLKKELDRQVEVGFLAKVNEPTDWVNSLVIAEKSNGKMRLCIDPKDLNKEIKREHSDPNQGRNSWKAGKCIMFFEIGCNSWVPSNAIGQTLIAIDNVQYPVWTLQILEIADGYLFCA